MLRRRDSKGERISPEKSGATALPSGSKRSRRWLRIVVRAIGAVLLLAVVIAAATGVFAYQQYPALNDLSVRFCNDMLAQNYSDAYPLLSAHLRSRYSKQTFVNMGQTLDTFEGNVESCGQISANQVQFGLFPVSLTIMSNLTRQKSGAHQGPMRVVYEQGAWRVDNLSSSLLGISPDAVAVALAWCDDTSRYNYVGVWSLYGRALQSQDPKSAVEQLSAKSPEGFALPPQDCTLTALHASGDLQRVSVTFEITTTSDFVNATLSQDDGRWAITTISPDSIGLLITASKSASPVTTVAANWLKALASGNCSSAYALLTTSAQQRISLAAFTSQVCLAWSWDAVVSYGVYTQSAAQTTIKIEFNGWLPSATPTRSFGPNGAVARPSAVITLVQEKGSWKVDSMQPL